MTTPRWYRSEILPFYDVNPGSDWGVPGFVENVLKTPGADPVLQCGFHGQVKTLDEGLALMDLIIKETGLRVINKSVRWDRDEAPKTLTHNYIWAIDEHSLISLSMNTNELAFHCNVVTDEHAFLEKVDAFFLKHTFQASAQEYIYAMVNKNGRLQFQRVGTAKVPLVADNYSAEVLEGYKRVVNELNSETPRGRIAIFDGPPGTGKTFMVRSILNDVGGIHVMIPSHMVASLADPSVLPAIIDLKNESDEPILFIIEDGDEVIAPRGADNMPAISSVLNLGDGIIGACLDVRVVITTNAKRREMDEAMTRPGRLISIVHVGKLTVAETNKVYKRITGTDGNFTQEMTIAEIYSKALDAGFKPVEKAGGNRKMGFGQ